MNKKQTYFSKNALVTKQEKCIDFAIKEALSGIYNLKSGKETEFSSYLEHITNELKTHKKHNKRTVEKIAADYGITNKNLVKELTELAIVKIARKLANQKNKSEYERYLDIVELYNNQVNLSHRTSRSTMFQQYSTPAPISYIASLYVSKNETLGAVKRGGRFTKNHFSIPKTSYREEPRKIYNRKQYFEPSAGNGLLTIALPQENIIVNEVDDIRLSHLRLQDFEFVSNQDASQPFTEYYKKFDGIITNPPFSTLPEPVIYDGYKIKHLDHLMALRALDTMKDNGRAAIIVGGHTKWDDKGRPQAGKNRMFLNYLFSHYNVYDVILIDGHKLYSRQGTAFDVRLILIDGRKDTIGGHAPLKTNEAATVIKDFEDLWIRVFGKLKGKKENKIKQVWEMTSKELIKNTIENMDIFKSQSSANWFKENSQVEVIDKRTGKSYNHYLSYKVTPTMLKKHGKEAHYNLIRKALRQGKDIPKSVLSEYPNLLDKQKRIRIAKVKAKAKLKMLNLVTLDGVQTNVLSVQNEYNNVPNSKIQEVADKFYTDNIQGKKVINLDQNIEIAFIRKGKKKSTKGRHVKGRLIPIDRVLATAINHLIELTENAKLSGSNTRLKQSHRKMGGVQWWNFYAKIFIDNKLYILTIPVLEIRKGTSEYKFQYSIDYSDIKKILAQDRPL